MNVNQPSGSPFKSVQTVSVSVDTSGGASTGSVSISSVTAAKCFISIAGWTTNITSQWGNATQSIGGFFARFTISAATTLTWDVGGGSAGVQVYRVHILELN